MGEVSHAQQGFTLLELMVVVVVIAVITATLMPAIARQNPDRQLLAEARRLELVLNEMCSSAELDGRILGLGLAKAAYAVYAPSREGWEELKKSPAYAAHALASGVSVTLQIDEQEIELVDDLTGEPQIPCAGSDELPPFNIELRSAGTSVRQRLAPDPATGLLVLSDPSQPPN